MQVKCLNCAVPNELPDSGSATFHGEGGAGAYTCWNCGAPLVRPPVKRQDSEGVAVGLMGGAALGGAFFGPVGAIVGGVVGALIGSGSAPTGAAKI